MRGTWRLFALILAALASASCGPQVATVSGTVSVDGAPLQNGTISYVAAEGEGAAAAATVTNGQYQVQTTPGKKLVQLSAPRVVGKHKEYNGPNAPEVDITEESLAEKYNAKTELTFDAQPGSNTKDWQVESKAGAK